MCSTGIGHADCLTQFTDSDYVGTKSDNESWRNSKDKVYLRKISKQQGKYILRRNQRT